jgi:membrane protease subunit (stomatin/prohibitin family)
MANGSMSISVAESRKFMLKLVGFRDSFDSAALIQKFRGIISSHVKDCLSKIMINGMLSYFMLNANIFEISAVVKERLDTVLDEYGVTIQYFNIETVEVPEKDYEAVTRAKERRSGRLIEGYTWQEERQMMISEKFASNEGTMGSVGGAMGGFMVGSAIGGNIADIARNALDPSTIPTSTPPKDTSGSVSPMGRKDTTPFDVDNFFKQKNENDSQSEPGTSPDKSKCIKCGAILVDNAKFCLECGEKTKVIDDGIICGSCSEITPNGKFCLHCGMPVARQCPKCGTDIPVSGKFCIECGEKL